MFSDLVPFNPSCQDCPIRRIGRDEVVSPDEVMALVGSRTPFIAPLTGDFSEIAEQFWTLSALKARVQESVKSGSTMSMERVNPRLFRYHNQPLHEEEALANNDETLIDFLLAMETKGDVKEAIFDGQALCQQHPELCRQHGVDDGWLDSAFPSISSSDEREGSWLTYVSVGPAGAGLDFHDHTGL